MKVLFPAELAELAELAQKFLFMQGVNYAEQGLRSHPADVYLPGVIREIGIRGDEGFVSRRTRGTRRIGAEISFHAGR